MEMTDRHEVYCDFGPVSFAQRHVTVTVTFRPIDDSKPLPKNGTRILWAFNVHDIDPRRGLSDEEFRKAFRYSEGNLPGTITTNAAGVVIQAEFTERSGEQWTLNKPPNANRH